MSLLSAHPSRNGNLKNGFRINYNFVIIYYRIAIHCTKKKQNQRWVAVKKNQAQKVNENFL